MYMKQEEKHNNNNNHNEEDKKNIMFNKEEVGKEVFRKSKQITRNSRSN